MTIPASPGVDEDRIQRRVLLKLKSEGATDITIQNGIVRFRAERASSNWNPLGPCRRGMFQIHETPQGFCIEYELDLAYLAYWYLAYWMMAAAGFATLLGLISLLKGSPFPLILVSVFFGAAIPLNHVFYSALADSMFEAAALTDESPAERLVKGG